MGCWACKCCAHGWRVEGGNVMLTSANTFVSAVRCVIPLHTNNKLLHALGIVFGFMVQLLAGSSLMTLKLIPKNGGLWRM